MGAPLCCLILLMAGTLTSIRTQFFDYLFDGEGYICIATANPDRSDFKQFFFDWPTQRSDIGAFLEAASNRRNVWFCTSLLEKQQRRKEHCLPGSLVWADLDTCSPTVVEPSPPCIIESSPRRYQALWRLEEPIEPYLQEEYSKRIAYKYNTNGADPSGWDLTQLLRVPTTHNYKYELEGVDVPEVKLIQVLESRVPVALFEDLPKPAKTKTPTGDDYAETLPDITTLPDANTIAYKYWAQLHNTAFRQLYAVEPAENEDWSKALWRLINIGIEAGMDDEEVFAACLTAKCNKYARDNRPPIHLWQDVLRASEGHRAFALGFSVDALTMPELVTQEEIDSAGDSFIDTYKDWAVEATDAIEEYHELSAFMLLSSVTSAGVSLDTSYGEMVPNLWGLILGDSTLTRKTTAMRMAMDILAELDSSLILATDGSAEGLLTGLSTRPNRTSLFYKDEISGFIDAINNKAYLAGMPETLTQLYDVPKIMNRLLRKEVITVHSPCFIFFGGGIRDRVYSMITDEYIISGFLPRFLVVAGEADLTKIKRTGPGIDSNSFKKDIIINRIADLYERYNGEVTIKVAGQEMLMPKARYKAILSDDAWQRYGDIEMQMVETANNSSISMLALPTFERLSRSLLKMAMLLAASENPPKDLDASIPVEVSHVVNAASYVQRWGRHTIDLLINGGKGASEKRLNVILNAILKNPGITRSDIMQRHHLTKRDADDILGTLEMRGQITMTKSGRGMRLKAV